MSHRRLLFVCALTVALALVALAAVTVPALSAPAGPPAPTATTSAPAVTYAGPTTDWHRDLEKAIQAGLDAQAQAAAAAQAAEAAKLAEGKAATGSARPGTRTEPAPAGAVADAVRQAFGDLFDQAWGVSGCESTHNPAAVSSGGGNWGLFQINTVHRGQFEAVTGHPWSDVLDAYLNAQFARWLYDQSGGWGPWSCAWAA